MLMKDMTADQIRARLAELGDVEPIDFEAKLVEALRSGGDIEALEEAQQQAERHARRVRVERAALEAELPAAIKRAGVEQLATLTADHAELAIEAKATADAVAAGWEAFSTAVLAWASAQRRAEAITRSADGLAKETGAPMPSLGTFRSPQIVGVMQAMSRTDHEIETALNGADRELQTSFGLQSHLLQQIAQAA